MIEKIDLSVLPEVSGELSKMRKLRAKESRQLELIGNALDALDAGILLLEQVEILKEEMATYNELLDDFNDANERVQGAQVKPEPKDMSLAYWKQLWRLFTELDAIPTDGE